MVRKSDRTHRFAPRAEAGRVYANERLTGGVEILSDGYERARFGLENVSR